MESPCYVDMMVEKEPKNSSWKILLPKMLSLQTCVFCVSLALLFLNTMVIALHGWIEGLTGSWLIISSEIIVKQATCTIVGDFSFMFYVLQCVAISVTRWDIWLESVRWRETAVTTVIR